MSDILSRIALAIRKEFDQGPTSSHELAKATLKALRALPEEPGPRYAAGEYSRRNIEALVDDGLSE